MYSHRKTMASQPVLNPWAREFFPLYAYTHVQKPAPALYPPPPSCYFPLPVVNSPITYNIYTAPHLQMNYPPPPAFPEFWNRSIPITDVNTNFPAESIRAQASSAQLMNVPVSPPPQQDFIAAPLGQEHHSRSLLLSSVPPELSEEELQQELKAWGPIRALHLPRKRQGLVIVDYYDLRHAKQALADINQKHSMEQKMVENNEKGKEVPSCCGLIGGKAVWARYAKPTAKNQGTLVVFNLDSAISPDSLRSTFEQYGAVKEVREPPLNNQVKFVEFFDVREAYEAKEALDEQEIGSKRVKIQFSHLGRRALRGPATPLHHRPPRHRQIIDNFRWNNVDQFCTHQAGVTNNYSNTSQIQTGLGYDQDSGRVMCVGGHAPSGGAGTFDEITGENSSQFAFDEGEALSNSAQARTTVMIKNIPNKYDLDMFLNILDSHCAQYNQNIMETNEPFSEYDFVYLPIDFKYVTHQAIYHLPLSAVLELVNEQLWLLVVDCRNRCNLGYAFVNFTSAKATWKLYREFHMHQWAIFNSKKICEITYARLQGRRLLEDHFRNARLECDTDNYLPLVFDPPRNGQNFTVTRVIRGQWEAKNDSHKHQLEHHYRQNRGQNYSR
ncbi:hypothetical protein KI387_031352, partial [Taxus chinensis]